MREHLGLHAVPMIDMGTVAPIAHAQTYVVTQFFEFFLLFYEETFFFQ